jgi:hypothetical protein
MLQASISVAALLITACLGAASGDLTAHVKSPQPAAKAPSQLDYLVLASLADSQHPLSMAAYQPSP